MTEQITITLTREREDCTGINLLTVNDENGVRTYPLTEDEAWIANERLASMAHDAHKWALEKAATNAASDFMNAQLNKALRIIGEVK